MAGRILVVDDDSTVCELIQEVLRSVEIESLAVTSGGLALTHLAKEKFDAVFLDVHMPPPDGIELTIKIRSGGLNLATPVMIITGEDDRALLSRAFGAGANFFLYKPIDRHDILRLLSATHDSIQQEKRRSACQGVVQDFHSIGWRANLWLDARSQYRWNVRAGLRSTPSRGARSSHDRFDV